MRLARALLHHLRGEAASTAWRLTAAAIVVVELLALVSAHDVGEGRRAWCWWSLPLLALYLLSRGAGAVRRRARSGELDLERARPLAAPARTLAAVGAPALLAALLVAGMLALGALWPAGPGFALGTSAGWAHRPYPNLPPMRLACKGEYISLPPFDVAREQGIELPLTWRPSTAAGSREGIRLRLELLAPHAAEPVCWSDQRPPRRATLTWNPTREGSYRLRIKHAGGAGQISIRAGELILHGKPLEGWPPALVQWARISIFLAWIALLAGAASWFLPPGLAFVLSACLLLPALLDPIPLFGWSRGGLGQSIWSTFIPSWPRGLGLDLWARGFAIPLADFPWRGVLVSGLLLFGCALHGELRGRTP